MSFDEFIDLEHDSGFWKISQLTYYPMLQMLESIMGRKPFVLFHDDLEKDPAGFFQTFADHVGATFDAGQISLKPVHRSYSEKQLKIIRSLRLYDDEPGGDPRNVLEWLKRRWRFIVCYAVLFPATLMPELWVPKAELIPEESLEEIRVHFQHDWDRCLEYRNAAVRPV